MKASPNRSFSRSNIAVERGPLLKVSLPLVVTAGYGRHLMFQGLCIEPASHIEPTFAATLTAGCEATGASNMKFTANGTLTMDTCPRRRYRQSVLEPRSRAA